MIYQAEKALRSVYLEVIQEVLNTKLHPFFAKIKHTSGDVWGKDVRKGIEVGEDGQFIQLVSELKNLYAQIEISDTAIKASADGRGVVTDILNNKLEDLIIKSKIMFSEMLFTKQDKMTGLQSIFDDEIIYGLKRADFDILQPKRIENFGEMTYLKLQKAIDDMGGAVDMILCCASTKYAYQSDCFRAKAHIDVMEVENGIKAISHLGIPIIWDRNCPHGEMYLLNTKHFKLHQICDWRFLESECGSILRQVQGKPTYTATLVKYADLICDNISKQMKISGVSYND